MTTVEILAMYRRRATYVGAQQTRRTTYSHGQTTSSASSTNTSKSHKNNATRKKSTDQRTARYMYISAFWRATRSAARERVPPHPQATTPRAPPHRSLPDELAVLVDVRGHAAARLLLGRLGLLRHARALELALVLREQG